jgi:uncharacterized protein (TIGR02453 family)
MLKPTFNFLQLIQKNNNRAWFLENKALYDSIIKENKHFFEQIFTDFQQYDHLTNFHVFRIYKDVRFSKDKTPYKTNFGASFVRSKPMLRGGYYVHLEPGNSFVGGGFWNPEPIDLFRIRKEFEYDDSEIRKITSDKDFIKFFGELQGEDAVKTAPKGFDKNHPAIDLIKKKQFVVMRKFSDEAVFSADFQKEIIATFLAMRPFLDYMTTVLTTDLNGELLIDK